MSNKKLGNTFEHDFCLLAAKKGWFAHKMQDNKNGQPADVFMVKNNVPALIDCKVCENGIFPLSRMEENQINAMELWLAKGNKYAAFVFKIKNWNLTRIIEYKTLKELKDAGVKSLNESELLKHSMHFSVWEAMISENN